MKAGFFETFSEAFALCRDRDRPMTVVITEPCNDCCCETTNATVNAGDAFKRGHRIYPSGRALPTMHAAEDYGP